MTQWFFQHSDAIITWAGALSTFAIYSILYSENRFYRLFEHIFIGLSAGYSLYLTWTDVLESRWWIPMVREGYWAWAFAAVVGSMFYFIFSKKHSWISKVIFGVFMGLAAGGMFREFYEVYFPQIASSIKPLITSETLAQGTTASVLHVLSVLVFYVILFSAMSYFFFSFEHKSNAIKNTVILGRWCLMIGFGAIFGATVMGRMALFIGRFNFLVNTWVPQVRSDWSWFRYVLAAMIIFLIFFVIKNKKARETAK